MSNLKKWVTIIGAIGSLIATIPPIITAFRDNPTVAINGNNNQVAVGSTVNSNNTTITNNIFIKYKNAWINGVTWLLSKENPKPYPVGSLGVVASNVSLIDGATWSLAGTTGDRVLDIDFKVQAEPLGEATGMVTVKLFDSKGSIVCTTTLNSATSHKSGKIFWDRCQNRSYVLLSNESITMRAEQTADNAKILAAVLTKVNSKAQK